MNTTSTHMTTDGIHWRTLMTLDLQVKAITTAKMPPDWVISRVVRPARIWYAERPGGYHETSPNMPTDGASIPWFFCRLIPQDRGRHWPPSLMHDDYYHTQTVSRAVADCRFREAMRIYGVGACKRWAMYIGLRLFGWIAWRQNARKLHRKH